MNYCYALLTFFFILPASIKPMDTPSTESDKDSVGQGKDFKKKATTFKEIIQPRKVVTHREIRAIDSDFSRSDEKRDENQSMFRDEEHLLVPTKNRSPRPKLKKKSPLRVERKRDTAPSEKRKLEYRYNKFLSEKQPDLDQLKPNTYFSEKTKNLPKFPKQVDKPKAPKKPKPKILDSSSKDSDELTYEQEMLSDFGSSQE